MSTPLTSLSTKPLPQGLKGLLPNPQVPWSINPDLLQRLQQTADLNRPFQCTSITQSDPEYAFILRYFFHNKPAGLGIAKISCIHNPKHIQKFEAELADLELRADKFPPKWPEEEPISLRGQAIDRWKNITDEFSPLRESSSPTLYTKVKALPLWHGSSGTKTLSIAEMGFTYFGKQHFYHEKARSGGVQSTDPGYYGSGIYFTNSASYATVYSPEHLILSWVSMNEPYPVVSDIPYPSLQNKCSDMTILEGRGAYQTYNAHYIPVSPLTPNSPDYFPCYYNQVPACDEVVVFQRSQTLPRFWIELTPDSPENLFFQDLAISKNDLQATTLFNNTFQKEVAAANQAHIQNFYYHIQAAFRDLFEQLFLQEAFKSLGPAPCGYDIRLIDNLINEDMTLCKICQWVILIENEKHRPYFLNFMRLIEKKMRILRQTSNLSFPLLISLSYQDSDNNNNNASAVLETIYTPEKLAKGHIAQLNRNLYNFIPLSYSTASLFKSYEEHFNTLLHTPDHSGYRPLHLYEEKRLQQALLSTTLEKAPIKGPKVSIKMPFSSQLRYLKPHLAEQILDPKGQIQRHHKDSLHQVARLQDGLYDLHFKQSPSQPMMEAFIHDLMGRMLEKATPANTLVRLNIEGQKVSYPVLVSETIEGKALSSTSIDKDHLSMHLLCTFLTLPGDGRMSNYIQDRFGKIFCIDNDISFVEPLIKTFLGTQAQFNSILFCQYPAFELTSKTIETFIKLPFERILYESLQAAVEREKSYVSLFTKEEIDAYYQDKEKGFTPYLLLREGTVIRLCLQFFALKCFLEEKFKENKKVEALELLSTCISLRSESVIDIGPKLYKTYQEACLKVQEPRERLKLATFSKQEKSMTTPQAMQASLGKIPTQEEIDKKKCYSTEKALQELFAFELHQNEGISFLINNDFLSIKVDFSKMLIDGQPDIDRQKLVLKGLVYYVKQSRGRLKEVTLNHCAPLTTQELLSFLQPSLTHLDLRYCPQLISNDILQIEEKCPHLEELYLSGCNRLYNLYRGNPFNKKPVEFKSLKILHLAHCNTEILSLIVPNIQELKANGNEKLEIKTLSLLPFPLKLELSGCKNYSGGEEIFKAFLQRAQLEDKELLDKWKKADLEGIFLKLWRNDSSLIRLEIREKEIGDIGMQALAKALEHNKTLSSLNLRGNNIGDAGAKALAKALEHNKTLSSLDLMSNNIGEAGAQALAKALEHNKTLTSLNLVWNRIGESGEQAFTKALRSNFSLVNLEFDGIKTFGNYFLRLCRNDLDLTFLDLSRNNMGEAGAQALAKALKHNSNLTSLDLQYNNIGEAGTQALAQTLEHNKTLASLDLRSNGIGEAGAQALAQTLEHNKTLSSLDLKRNKIGEAGVQALAQALEHNKTLTSLNLWGNKIGTAGALALAMVLEHNSILTSLNLQYNNIRDVGAEALAKALEHNSTLSSLNLRGNNIGEAGGVQALAKALEHNSTLSSLNLKYNNIGEAGAEALAKALEHNSTLSSLDLQYNNIGETGAEALAKALERNSTLSSLDLQYNNIGEAGAEALAKALEHNSPLTALKLVQNNIGDAGALALAKALEHNSTLTSLNLQYNKIGETGTQAIAKALEHNSTLSSLNLKYNKIGDPGTQALAKVLEHNSTLTSLELSSNNIGEAGAQALAKALERNSTLSSLNLEHNNIGDVGVQALAKALRSNSSLVTLEFDGIKTLGSYFLRLCRNDPDLTSLNLRGNDIRDAGAETLAKALELNSTITSLNLGDNNIGEAGVQALAKALEHNKTITSLSLWNNNIRDAGAQALAKALEHNKTITSLNLGDNKIGEIAQRFIAKLLERNRNRSSKSNSNVND